MTDIDFHVETDPVEEILRIKPEEKLSMLIAHPDDEVIFGWAMLNSVKKIVCASSDMNNPERAWCKDRKLALMEVGKLLGVEVVCLDYNSEFYRVNAREGGLITLQDELKKHLGSCVFTHNAWGEYGHLDHILIHQIAKAVCKRVLTTDIVVDGGWLNVRAVDLGRKIDHRYLDADLYNEIKRIYDRYGCWTWSKFPITEAGVYEAYNELV